MVEDNSFAVYIAMLWGLVEHIPLLVGVIVMSTKDDSFFWQDKISKQQLHFWTSAISAVVYHFARRSRHFPALVEMV